MPLDVHAAMRALMRAEAARCPANATPPPPPAIDPEDPMIPAHPRIDPPGPAESARPTTGAMAVPANAPRRRPPRPRRLGALPRALQRVWSFPLVRSGPAGDR
ncbi:hypothetical protein HUT19_37835 [Streptomyces sp. NA02950]|uniref:hypothetical protein n=1 Tax=Streptomyces sp. NA02950 TaxID=2742137 RepID=UPI00159235F4|nr:hypothetical protein [Streptomyces sp. NA02950]QKV96751.1 hypothetical protein HUT19_37835 [Streptomyces sp. NA02950]